MILNNRTKNKESADNQFDKVITRLVENETSKSLAQSPKQYPRSPLRYPGGKSRATKQIFSYIPQDEVKLCSPFLGGASVELICTTRMHVYGADIFEPLIAFWRALLTTPDQLIERVNSYYPLSRTKFYTLQKSYTQLTNELERAAAFFVLNRASFSGTTLSGGMSPGHPRFTRSAIERLRNFKANNFEVECADFRQFIPKHSDAFLYLDPPYMNGQALYGMNGNTHKGFDHQSLAEILYKRNRWIMSYNDCQQVRELYADYPIVSVEWIYGMSNDKQSREILILSKGLSHDTLTK